MNTESFENRFKKFSKSIYFNHSLKKLNWFNIGGNTNIYFKPSNLQDLIEFLKIYKSEEKIFVIGAGSNVLFKDDTFEGAVIKLGKNFSRISILNENTLIAGSGVLDKSLSEFALKNNISGFEFLSCIPGTVGGGIRMNSGCFGSEFKDILVSVQAINRLGEVITIPAKDIIFGYRFCNLAKDLIFLSASFRGIKGKSDQIEKEVKNLKTRKEKAQPTRIKTGGSTFKNPIEQTNRKVWEIIKESIPDKTQFGDAVISDKHANFFINKNNASYKDMKELIDFVKENVKNKTGIKLDLEIILVE
ncbi:UDP-N-acetylmuramate dehydrogenase [Candidatus Pelagibacter sp.]|nr:UDP-N-acetylmuramate dehydrogenase [Candidatus Pelagibacter sp.]